jgi:hypothetical protein
MATQRQIEANRRNARKSTGPRTLEGKASSSRNALTHGLTAEAIVLPHEEWSQYVELRLALLDTYQPANPAEQMLVDLVAGSYWRLLRCRRLETRSFSLHIDTVKQRNDVDIDPGADDDGAIVTAMADPSDTFRVLSRHYAAVERTYFKALEALRKAQNDRLRRERMQTQPEPAPPPPAPVREIGFVLHPQEESARPAIAAGVRTTPAVMHFHQESCQASTLSPGNRNSTGLPSE